VDCQCWTLPSVTQNGSLRWCWPRPAACPTLNPSFGDWCTLVAWGENDPYHPLTMAHEFGRRIRGAQVEILPDCGHLPHEERPDDFNRLALKFLAQPTVSHFTS